MISGELRSILQGAPPDDVVEALGWYKRLTAAWSEAAVNAEAHAIISRYVLDLMGERADAVIERVAMLDLIARMRAWPLWGGEAYDGQDPWQLYNLVGIYAQEMLIKHHQRPGFYLPTNLHVQPSHHWMLGELEYGYVRDDIWYRLDAASAPERYDGPFEHIREVCKGPPYPPEYSAPLFDVEPDDDETWARMSREPKVFIQTMSVEYFEANRADLTLYTNDFFADNNNLDSFTDSTYYEQFTTDIARFIEETLMFTVFFDADGCCHHVEGCWGHKVGPNTSGAYIDCWE